MTVHEMVERMSLVEFQRWLWHHEIYPLGSVAQDARFAALATVINNLFAKKENRKPVTYFEDRKAKALSGLASTMQRRANKWRKFLNR